MVRAFSQLRAPSSEQQTEVFIRGLAESARKDSLTEYMEQFGQVEKCQVFFVSSRVY